MLWTSARTSFHIFSLLPWVTYLELSFAEDMSFPSSPKAENIFRSDLTALCRAEGREEEIL